MIIHQERFDVFVVQFCKGFSSYNLLSNVLFRLVALVSAITNRMSRSSTSASATEEIILERGALFVPEILEQNDLIISTLN